MNLIQKLSRKLIGFVAVIMAALTLGCGGAESSASSSPGSGGTGISPGSGGTGVYASVGPINGFGSVIVNSVKLDTASTTYELEDVTTPEFGMMARISGTLSGSETTGTAAVIAVSPEIQGMVSSVQVASNSFVVMSHTMKPMTSTVWIGISGISQLQAGDPVRIHGYAGDGLLVATRIEKLSATPTSFKLTGPIQHLDLVARTFQLGTQTISYSTTTLSGFGTQTLTVGMPVTVSSSSAPSSSIWNVNKVQLWWSANLAVAGNVHLSGVATDFVNTNQFKILGVAVDTSGSGVQFSADRSNLADGTVVQIKGRWNGTTLIAQRVTFISGAAGEAVIYSSQGSIGAFQSATDYRVRGVRVANAPSVVYINGSAADLNNGNTVRVEGLSFQSGILQVNTVTFIP